MDTKKETAVAISPDKEILDQPKSEVKLNIDLWITTRKEFKEKVGSIMLEGSDYHIIQNKKSLAKGGAEKIASIFGWSAAFVMDSETLAMIGDVKGTLAYICDLLDKSGRTVGQGRGASSLSKNSGDVNRAVKMAQKSAFIDAVLRASGLSDIYTQDLEDMDAREISQPQKFAKKPSEKQLNFIKDLCQQKGYTKEDLIDQGFGAGFEPSELIDWLLKAPSRIINGEEIRREDLPA